MRLWPSEFEVIVCASCCAPKELALLIRVPRGDCFLLKQREVRDLGIEAAMPIDAMGSELLSSLSCNPA